MYIVPEVHYVPLTRLCDDDAYGSASSLRTLNRQQRNLVDVGIGPLLEQASDLVVVFLAGQGDAEVSGRFGLADRGRLIGLREVGTDARDLIIIRI